MTKWSTTKSKETIWEATKNQSPLLDLSGHILFRNIFFELHIKFFFLSGPAFTWTPNPLFAAYLRFCNKKVIKYLDVTVSSELHRLCSPLIYKKCFIYILFGEFYQEKIATFLVRVMILIQYVQEVLTQFI